MPPYVGLLGESQDISSVQQETKHHLGTYAFISYSNVLFLFQQTNKLCTRITKIVII